MTRIEDHPLRYRLANELHARPFPVLDVPGHAAYLALKIPEGAAGRDRAVDMAHLIALLDRFGAKHPQPGATHYFGDLGRFRLKWEQHTEFVTYTVFAPGVADRPFDKTAFGVFPEDWLAEAPGLRLTSALIRVEKMGEEVDIVEKLADWFVPESLAASRILDGAAVMASDFRIDSGGHMRFGVFVAPGTGPRRAGRVVQRICEIETYKAMAMLGLMRVHAIGPQLNEVEDRLERLTEAMAVQSAAAEDTLTGLLATGAELESIAVKTGYRFSATAAYAALVANRIEVLRETRLAGRQTFREFMARRFDPSMRTVVAAQARISTMVERSARAGDLLRTRVDVERSAQNQALLASMDRRADLQLRLQRTVEGLSVVAISYYAVNLATYLFYPLAAGAGVSKTWLTAGLTPLVLFGVFLMVRRLKKHLE